MPTSFSAQTLLLEGPDALAFAHAQFSSDVAALAVGRWQFSAWLDAQGRVRALFHLARLDEQRLLLLLRGGEAEALRAALQRYVFRMQLAVRISPWHAIVTGAATPMGVAQLGDDGVSLGCGDHALHLRIDDNDDDHWQTLQQSSGWPWLPASTLGTLLPPALSLHRLHAVAVDKGCYPGQEIVSRLHWRGGHKRQLCTTTFDVPMVPGTSLRCDGRDIGVVLGHDGRPLATALVVLTGEHSAIDANLVLDNGESARVQYRWDA